MMRRAFITNIAFVTCWAAVAQQAMPNDEVSPASPVIQTGVPHPTRDKPQSKLWHAHGNWWAWLPTPTGSAIWKRTGDGWQRQAQVSQELDGVVGRADVWSNADVVRAVIVAERQLTMVQLTYDAQRGGYRVGRQSNPRGNLPLPPTDRFETATIARDGRGHFWIAYVLGTRVMVQQLLVASETEMWTPPHQLGEPTAADDICAVAALPGGIGVVWTNQLREAVFFARHVDGAQLQQWEPIETVDQGRRTADDHVHLAVRRDGTLLAATKNSVDAVGSPQLVLRIRRPDGRWENRPYAVATTTDAPSRPIVLLGGEQERPLLLHSNYPRKLMGRLSSIFSWTIDPATLEPRGPGEEILRAAVPLNNVTGCKQTLPDDVPWIVLASDAGGNVYEVELPRPTGSR